VDDREWITGRFAEHRGHLRAVAFRMLGSAAEADDAVQEAWIKIDRADSRDLDTPRGWLTTVVARVCLDMLRARKARPHVPLEAGDDAIAPGAVDAELALADALGPALQVVLDTLVPAERVAFVLHDLFDLPFDVIGPILDRSPIAARQLASRARRRIRGPAAATSDAEARRELVGAFLAASRDGDFEALVALLSPGVVLRADELAVRMAGARDGAPDLAAEVRGAPAVANAFKGRARAAKPAIIDGEPGAVWLMGGHVRAAFLFVLDGNQVVELDIVTEPSELAELEIEI